LIIKSNGNILSTSYHGQYDEKELNPLFHLTDYLDKIIMNVTESSDSVFVFESKPKLILPPPSPAPPIQN
jgi:predicted DNA-binding ArsR family transcriptional regulator